MVPALGVLIASFAYFLINRRHLATMSEAASADSQGERDRAGRRIGTARRLRPGSRPDRGSRIDPRQIAQYLPTIAGSDRVWVLIREGTQWEALAGDTRGSDEMFRWGDLAEQLLTGQTATDTASARSGFPCSGLDRDRRDRRSHPGRRHQQRTPPRHRSVGAASRARHSPRATGPRAAREQRSRRADRVLHAQSCDRGNRRRAAPRAPQPGAGVARHVRHRSPEGRQRSPRPPRRRRRARCHRQAHARGVARLGPEVPLRRRTVPVLLPETPLAGAKRVAETLRREVADRPVAWAGGEPAGSPPARHRAGAPQRGQRAGAGRPCRSRAVSREGGRRQLRADRSTPRLPQPAGDQP